MLINPYFDKPEAYFAYEAVTPTGTLYFYIMSKRFLDEFLSSLTTMKSFPNISKNSFNFAGVSYSGFTVTNTDSNFKYYYPSLDLLILLIAFDSFINVIGHTSGHKVDPKYIM